MAFQYNRVKQPQSQTWTDLDHNLIYVTYWLTNQKLLGMAVRGLHGEPVVRGIRKSGSFCMEDNSAFGRDPESLWPHAHTSTVIALPASLAAFG